MQKRTNRYIVICVVNVLKRISALDPKPQLTSEQRFELITTPGITGDTPPQDFFISLITQVKENVAASYQGAVVPDNVTILGISLIDSFTEPEVEVKVVPIARLDPNKLPAELLAVIKEANENFKTAQPGWKGLADALTFFIAYYERVSTVCPDVLTFINLCHIDREKNLIGVGTPGANGEISVDLK